MNTIGNQIKALRKFENLTQIEFSKRLLISQSYLSGMENGNEIPTNKLIKLICLEFGVNENWLISNSGEMYDEVFENDKSALVDISNAALLKIMTMFSTKSNVKYGCYATSLDLFASMLEKEKLFIEDDKLQYLELIQNFIMDFERMIYISFSDDTISHIERHKQGVFTDIEQIIAFIEKVNIIPNK